MTSYDLIWQLIDMLLAEKSKAEETKTKTRGIHYIVGSGGEIAVYSYFLFLVKKNSMCNCSTHTDSKLTSYD